ILGAHPHRANGVDGVVVRAFHPDAQRVELLLNGDTLPLATLGDGVFAVFLAGATFPLRYHLRFHFADGATWEHADPYRFLPTIGEVDLHLFNEGTHRRIWDRMGAHECELQGERGVAFAVWAPNAQRVSVVGDFCQWDGRLLPMRVLGASGIFEIFVPEVTCGALYKFEILTREGTLRLKTDPFAL